MNINDAIAAAKLWWSRESDAGKADKDHSGYAIVTQDACDQSDCVAGWSRALDKANSWIQNCFAVPIGGGEIHIAAGGDWDKGAESWISTHLQVEPFK